MTTDNNVKEKSPQKMGRYATAEEAAKVKNEKLVALLKKLDVKATTTS